jgi:hypothetical protein
LLSQDLKSTTLKLTEVEEQAASAAQALEKAELELEILHNEHCNDRQALEKLRKSTAAADLSLTQREQQLAPSLSRTQAEEVKHLVNTAKGQQRKACQVQVEAEEKEKKAAQEQMQRGPRPCATDNCALPPHTGFAHCPGRAEQSKPRQFHHAAQDR